MTGRMSWDSIHSTMADEQGAQQACNSTSLSPSGMMMFFDIFMMESGKVVVWGL